MDDSGKRALWTKLVADFELAGQSQRAFAEARQVELSNLRYWIYKLRNESRPLATEKDSPPAQPEQAERRAPARASRMLPVRVVASTAPKAREAVAVAGLLELALPSGAEPRSTCHRVSATSALASRRSCLRGAGRLLRSLPEPPSCPRRPSFRAAPGALPGGEGQPLSLPREERQGSRRPAARPSRRARGRTSVDASHLAAGRHPLFSPNACGQPAASGGIDRPQTRLRRRRPLFHGLKPAPSPVVPRFRARAHRAAGITLAAARHDVEGSLSTWRSFS